MSLLRTRGHSGHFRSSQSLKRPLDKDIAIVDVRDADYEGGHITGAIHSPSATFLNGGVDSLRDQVKDKKTVIFHCMLSQVRCVVRVTSPLYSPLTNYYRGPKAARVSGSSAARATGRLMGFVSRYTPKLSMRSGGEEAIHRGKTRKSSSSEEALRTSRH